VNIQKYKVNGALIEQSFQVNRIVAGSGQLKKIYLPDITRNAFPRERLIVYGYTL
jgi:hypothetical protein